MARPSALTPERRERIERDLEDGIPIVVVAQNAGVGRSTLHEWISTGRVERRESVATDSGIERRADPLALVQKPPAEDASSPTLEDRLADAEEPLVASVVRAAQRGNWRAASWLLERLAPERWARPLASARPRERVSPAGDPFAEVDELAAARSRKLRR